jgi:hypothetical protein
MLEFPLYSDSGTKNEAVESDAANKMMDLIRNDFVSGDLSALSEDSSGIKLVAADEFE